MRDNAELKPLPPPNADVSQYVPENANTGTLNIQFLTNTAPHKRNMNPRNPAFNKGPGGATGGLGQAVEATEVGEERGAVLAPGARRKVKAEGFLKGWNQLAGGEKARLGVWLPGKLLEWVP